MRALSVYIHLPWCLSKCPYCDFNSHPLPAGRRKLAADIEQRYTAALLRDIHHHAGLHSAHRIDSVFIGGGTPSLFSPASIDRILSTLNDCLPFTADVEITLESNPGTFDADHYQGYFACGVNRLSLGAQSFDDLQLRRLGRIHTSTDTLAAFTAARKAGFDNVNLDIMHSLPQQTLQQALDDLRDAIALAPEHLSWYQLTVEPNTLFSKDPPPLPDEDQRAETMAQGTALLADHQYVQYEISAYAQPGRRCRHNLNYWRFGDYLGFGAGAHAKLTQHSPFAVRRCQRCRHPKDYMQKAGTAAVYSMRTVDTPGELIFEFLLNHLRLYEDPDFASFERRTGLSGRQLRQAAAPAVARGLLEITETGLRLTTRGRDLLDDLLQLLLPE